MRYIEELETFRENNWINFVKCDGIIKEANKDTDLWVCQTCKEVHKFKYDNELRVLFDQEVLK